MTGPDIDTGVVTTDASRSSVIVTKKNAADGYDIGVCKQSKPDVGLNTVDQLTAALQLAAQSDGDSVDGTAAAGLASVFATQVAELNTPTSVRLLEVVRHSLCESAFNVGLDKEDTMRILEKAIDAAFSLAAVEAQNPRPVVPSPEFMKNLSAIVEAGQIDVDAPDSPDEEEEPDEE